MSKCAVCDQHNATVYDPDRDDMYCAECYYELLDDDEYCDCEEQMNRVFTKNNFTVMVGGGVMECVRMVEVGNPIEAVEAYFNGQEDAPLCCTIFGSKEAMEELREFCKANKEWIKVTLEASAANKVFKSDVWMSDEYFPLKLDEGMYDNQWQLSPFMMG